MYRAVLCWHKWKEGVKRRGKRNSTNTPFTTNKNMKQGHILTSINLSLSNVKFFSFSAFLWTSGLHTKNLAEGGGTETFQNVGEQRCKHACTVGRQQARGIWGILPKEIFETVTT